MPHRRTTRAGSFGGHFDELVKHFPHASSESAAGQAKADARERQEKLDIHALLFERAWEMDREEGGGNAA
ncbi:MAG: hypothetical protein ACJ8D5_05640 [Sphingomicrobium sp.]